MILRRAGLGLAGVLLGGWLSWPEPAPTASVPVEPSSRPSPDCPPLPASTPSKAPPDLQQVRQRRAELEQRLLAITGVPQPFTDAVGELFRPARVRQEVEAVAAEADLEIVELDCSEYPCLLLARMKPESDCSEAGDLLTQRGYTDATRCAHGEVQQTLTRVLADPAVPAEDLRIRYRLRELQTAE